MKRLEREEIIFYFQLNFMAQGEALRHLDNSFDW